MGKYQKLGKNVALLTLGNFASKILSFLLVPFYTAVLSTAEYGTADMLTTTVNLVMPIFTLLVYEAVMRYALDQESDKRQVFSVGVYVTAVGSLCVICGGLILHSFETFKPYVWLFILYYISLALYNLALQFAKGIEKVGVFSLTGIINTFVYIMCNIIFLIVFKWGVKGYLLAFVVGHTVAAIYCFLSAKMYKYIIGLCSVKMESLKAMLRYACPMIPNSISWWISNSSDKYILTLYHGVTANGIYSVAYKIPSILTIVINIFISAWQISAVDNFGSEESKRFYADIYSKYEGLLYIGAIFLIGTSKILARYLFSNEFYLAWMYTPVLIAASLFSSLAAFYGSVYTSAKKTSMLMISTIISAVVNIVLNFAFIPSYGAMGAAIATMISYIVLWVIRAIHSRKLFSFAVNIKKEIVLFLIMTAEIILLCLDYNPYFAVSLISFVLVCIICQKTLLNIFHVLVHKLKKTK